MTFARARNRFDPHSDQPFRLSRSKLDLFLNCPRCFYLDRRRGVSWPPSFPFNLNNAVDTLLKKEFDGYRERGIPHPLMTKHGIQAVPFRHEKLDHWRDALHGGIEFHHVESGFILAGGVDDLWSNAQNELVIVDYKATSKNDKVSIEAPWQIGYKRQMEIYGWLFRQNGFAVAKTAYFVYCNGLTSRSAFDARLDFDISVLPYAINDAWVPDALRAARTCLSSEKTPDFSPNCAFCRYQQALNELNSQLTLDL